MPQTQTKHQDQTVEAILKEYATQFTQDETSISKTALTKLWP